MNDKSKPASDMPAGLNELSFGTGRSMLQITSMETAWRLAKLRSVAKTVQPDSPEALTICILYGQEVGLTPLMAMEKIALINGRPTIWGDGALALVMTNPLFEDIEEHIEGTGDERVAYCTVMRRGQSPKTSTFSVSDAKRAGLWDERPTVGRTNRTTGAKFEVKNDAPWHKYANRMLQMRARGFRLHDSFPDVLGGMYLREELEGQTIEHEALEPPKPPEPPVTKQYVDEAVANGSRDTAANSGLPVPPAPPPFVDHPHITEAEGSAVSVAFMGADEADNLLADYEARVRAAASEETLDDIWGTLITPLIDADRLDDSVLQRLQNIDDERRGVLQQ